MRFDLPTESEVTNENILPEIKPALPPKRNRVTFATATHTGGSDASSLQMLHQIYTPTSTINPAIDNSLLPNTCTPVTNIHPVDPPKSSIPQPQSVSPNIKVSPINQSGYPSANDVSDEIPCLLNISENAVTHHEPVVELDWDEKSSSLVETDDIATPLPPPIPDSDDKIDDVVLRNNQVLFDIQIAFLTNSQKVYMQIMCSFASSCYPNQAIFSVK